MADALTPLSIAFWYMDDGSLAHSELQRDRAAISTDGFSEKDIDVLIQGLLRFDLHPVKQPTKGKIALRFKADDAERLFKLIAPYVPEVMHRKLPAAYRQAGLLPPVVEVPPIFRPSIETIVSVKPVNYAKPITSALYDLETETHNYVAGAIVVHNSNLRSYVNPDSGQVQWATRGMLEAGMGNSTFGDFAAMAREVASEFYPALLDASLVSRYTFICELIYPSNRIVTNYGDRRDLPVITIVDLASGQELSRREVVALCEQYKLSTVEALKPQSGDFDEAIAELRAVWSGTDFEGVVIAVEVPGRPYPYRIKVKGEHYLALMRLIHYCTLGRTREIAEGHNLGDLPSFLAYLKAENPDLPEEVRMAYEGHFAHYIAWENENRAEIERLIGVYWAHPLAGTPDRKSFALSIADHPDKWALFMIRDSGPEGARMRMLPLVRRQREKLLKVGEPASLEDRLALAG